MKQSPYGRVALGQKKCGRDPREYTPRREIRPLILGCMHALLIPAAEAVGECTRGGAIANSPANSFHSQLSHSALGFLRVALGWRYDPHHEFTLKRVGWSLWIL